MKERCLVVGGSGGVGWPIVEYFATRGASVAVLCSNLPRTRDKSESLRANGASIECFAGNAKDEGEFEDALSRALEFLGGVDISINCCGISQNAVSWKMSSESWLEQVDVNLTSAFRVVRKVVPTMRNQNYGRVISISSVVGRLGIPGTSAYASTKAGLEGLTRAVAAEVAGKGVTVNALALGYFNVGIISQVPEDNLKRIVQQIPVGRLGTPDEYLAAIEFLTSRSNSYFTGQTLHLNGGLLTP